MKQKQAFHNAEFNTRETDGEKIIEGYFIVYDKPALLCPGLYEVMRPGSCGKAVRSRDVRALYNHNDDIVLGRASAGTLTLTEDSCGVKGTIVINQNDAEACNIYERVRRRDITGCSFSFNVDEGGETYEYRDDGAIEINVTEAQVIEVSVCPFPAYTQTDIRTRKNDCEQFRREKLETKKNIAKERLAHVINNA